MLTHTEFFYEVWAEKIRSKPIPPYGAPPNRVDFFIVKSELPVSCFGGNIFPALVG